MVEPTGMDELETSMDGEILLFQGLPISLMSETPMLSPVLAKRSTLPSPVV